MPDESFPKSKAPGSRAQPAAAAPGPIGSGVRHSVPAVHQPGAGYRRRTGPLDGGVLLLEKLAQLTRFGLGAEDPPLLEPAEKGS